MKQSFFLSFGKFIIFISIFNALYIYMMSQVEFIK